MSYVIFVVVVKNIQIRFAFRVEINRDVFGRLSGIFLPVFNLAKRSAENLEFDDARFSTELTSFTAFLSSSSSSSSSSVT